MSKKGFFFTLISVSLIAILIIIFSKSYSPPIADEASGVRLLILNSWIEQVEDSYLPMALRISTIKAIEASVLEMNRSTQYLVDPNVELGRVVLNGTLGGTVVISDSILLNFTRKAQALSDEVYGLELSIVPHSVFLNQSSPWSLEARANLTLSAKSELGNWSEKDVIIEASIPINGFLDPSYLLGSSGRYEKRVFRSSISPSKWNISQLDSLIQSGNYTRFEDGKSPSYLERFKSEPLASFCCGIESVIDPSLISPSDQEKSYADYQFFEDELECEQIYSVDGPEMGANDFKLDLDHVLKYNVTTSAQELSC